MKIIASLLLSLACTGYILNAQPLSSVMESGERLMSEGRYSEAKYHLMVGLMDFSEDELLKMNEKDPVLIERYTNDIIESKILSGDCISVFGDFQNQISFKSEREGVRRFHLNSLWLRQPGIKEYYKQQGFDAETTNVQLCEYIISAFETVRDFITDSDKIERILYNDLLLAYWDIDDEPKIYETINKMRHIVESTEEGTEEWPRYFWYFVGEKYKQDGNTREAEFILKKVLSAMLTYDPDSAYLPWASLMGIYNDRRDFSSIHALTAHTAGIIRDKTLEKLRRMTYEDRQMPLQNQQTIRAYNVLTKLPKGTYEDILYDAALFSKHVLMDIDAETTRNVHSINNNELSKAYYDMLRLQGSEGSWYPNYLFLKLYQTFNPEESPMHYSWRDVQRQLGEHDVAVEFLRVGARYQDYVALVLRKGWRHPELVELCSEEDIKSLRADAITHREDSKFAGWRTFGLISNYLEEGDNVYYSCDGKYAQLNFDAFYDFSDTLLGDAYRLHRVTTTLCLPKESNPSKYDHLVLFGGMDYSMDIDSIVKETELYHKVYPVEMMEWKAPYGSQFDTGNTSNDRGSSVNPLKYSGDEIRQIASFWSKPEGVHIRLKEKAVEESFKYWGITSSPNEKNIFHIATHSCASKVPDNYLLSRQEVAFKRDALLFSGSAYALNNQPYPEGRMNDGILFSEEIAVLDLRSADLVVMSACSTARGEDTLDGVYGLQRAFKKAGAKTIIMTLWQTNDKATMRFMSVFYHNLLSGKTKYDSFKTAQVTIRDEFNGDPYYWAPFIMLD